MADQAKESLQVRSGGDQAEGESTPSTDSAQPQEAASQAAEQAGGVAQQAVGAAQAGGDAVQEGVEEVTSAVTGEKKGSGIRSILSAPGSYGNAAGNAIQGALGKVGNPVGKGLETVAAPVGGIIDPIVGGVFRAPENFAKAVDANKEVDQHNEDLAKPIAGKEETAKNPLGLNE